MKNKKQTINPKPKRKKKASTSANTKTSSTHGEPHARAGGKALKEPWLIESPCWSNFYPERLQPMKRIHTEECVKCEEEGMAEEVSFSLLCPGCNNSHTLYTTQGLRRDRGVRSKRVKFEKKDLNKKKKRWSGR